MAGREGTAPATNGPNTPFSQLNMKKLFQLPLIKLKCAYLAKAVYIYQVMAIMEVFFANV